MNSLTKRLNGLKKSHSEICSYLWHLDGHENRRSRDRIIERIGPNGIQDDIKIQDDLRISGHPDGDRVVTEIGETHKGD